MRIVTLLLLICVVSLIFVGQSMYQSDLENDELRDIYQQTEESFNWTNYSTIIKQSLNEGISDSVTIKEYDVNVKRVKNILIKFIDFAGFSTFEISKWGIEYGYEHPEHDLGFFLNFLIKIFWIILLITIVPLVIPFLAIIYLIFKGIFWVFKKIFCVKVGKKERTSKLWKTSYSRNQR